MILKTKEKYRIIVMIGAAVILLFAILYFATYKETDILNVSTDEIKSIYVTNGLNGDMVDVPSSDFCDFANALNEVKLKKGRKVDSTGWDYGINLSDGKNDYRLSFVSELKISLSVQRYMEQKNSQE